MTFLVPVNYSRESHQAFRMALQLASRVGARVLLCYVYQPPVLLATEDDPVFALPEHETKQEALGRLRKYVKQAKKSMQTQVTLDFMVTAGPVVEGLLGVVKEHTISMVVMGTKGYISVLDKLFGTVTEELVQHSPCPVLVVPADFDEVCATRIVYASALEPTEADAVQVLKQVKTLFHAFLTMLYVDTDGKLGEVNVAVRKNSLLRDFAADEVFFKEIKSKHVEEGVKQYVDVNKPDLVAFTVSEHGLWQGFFHSSITSQLLQHLHVPMLALPKLGKSTAFVQMETKSKV